mmetsp:Transcript_12514/g.12293  ORF Transcript_12514/g.12293 Transcript_12514/m.12293 type:complete len:151 (+) Transcript_12514:1216-1668(+)
MTKKNVGRQTSFSGKVGPSIQVESDLKNDGFADSLTPFDAKKGYKNRRTESNFQFGFKNELKKTEKEDWDMKPLESARNLLPKKPEIGQKLRSNTMVDFKGTKSNTPRMSETQISHVVKQTSFLSLETVQQIIISMIGRQRFIYDHKLIV